MAYNSFIFEVADGIATIRLNDPDRLNALTFETYAELERVFAAMAADSAVQSRRAHRYRQRILLRRQRSWHHR